MISAIEELIYIAADRTETEDYQGKHGAKAKKGWYRYDTRFGIPKYDENGNEYLYTVEEAEEEGYTAD